jgi:dTDP-4-dehydrorhamnose 3,5-epimerase
MTERTERLTLEQTPLTGLQVLQRHPIGDSRGYFERLFCDDVLAAWLGDRAVRQINRTRTVAAGTVRGLHFQYAPWAEAKLVSCLQGEVFDVAVDLRRHSPTFLQWHGEVLSGDNHRSLLIPEGFAHGFQTLVGDCELLYVHTAPHAPGAEGGVHPSDPRLRIAWPLPVAGLSPRDAGHQRLTDAFTGLTP